MLCAPMRGTVIVCDDDAGIRTVVCEHLRPHGYTVVEAESGEQALSSPPSTTWKPSCSTSTCPDSTAGRRCSASATHPATASIPVVILSERLAGRHPRPDRPQLTGDAQGWVQKPFNSTSCFAELGRVLHPATVPPTSCWSRTTTTSLRCPSSPATSTPTFRIDHAGRRQEAIRHCIIRPPTCSSSTSPSPTATVSRWLSGCAAAGPAHLAPGRLLVRPPRHEDYTMYLQ